MRNPDNPAQVRDWFEAFVVRSPQDFRDATVRYRTIFGVRIMEADPGRRLTQVYTTYEHWHQMQGDPGAADHLRSALRDYLEIPNGKNSLDRLRGQASTVNWQHREERGLHNFFELLDYLEILKGDAAWTPIQSDIWQKQWDEKQRIARRNAIVFFGNINVTYEWKTLGLGGLMGIAGPTVELIGEDNLASAGEAVRTAAASLGNAIAANPAATALVALETGELGLLAWAATHEPVATPDEPSYLAKFKKFLWDIFASLGKTLKEQYEKIFRNVEIEHIGTICSAICAVVFTFVAHEASGIVSSSLEIGTNVATGIQSAWSSMNLAAASAAVGVKHEYWRIIEGSLQWGESQSMAAAVAGAITSVAGLVATLFAGPAAPIAHMIISGVKTIFKATWAYLTTRNIEEALGKARKMAQKLQDHEAGLPTDEDTMDAIRGAMIDHHDEISAIDRRYQHVNRGLRKLDIDAYRTEAAKMSSEYAALIAQRNQPTSFDPATCTAEALLAPKGEFVRFLTNLCYASPVLTSALVLSGIMADAALITPAFAGSGPSQVVENLSQEYVTKAAATAQRLYTSSGFRVTPLPLNPHFSNIETEWQTWIKLGSIRPTTITAS